MKRLSVGAALWVAIWGLTFSTVWPQEEHVHDNKPLNLAAVADVNQEDVLRVTGNIVCTCGCPPTLVRACSCHRAEEMTREVESLLAAGKTDEEIYQHYVSQFGSQVLAAPKPEGFNLVGWVLPFVALVVGGAGVALAYKKLRTRESALAAASRQTTSKGDREKYRRLLDRELSED